MDIQKYIASGILENYVLGLISEEERREVEANVQLYPKIKAEIAAIEDTLRSYAKTKAMPMPKGLSKQINAHIANLSVSDAGPKKKSNIVFLKNNY